LFVVFVFVFVYVVVVCLLLCCLCFVLCFATWRFVAHALCGGSLHMRKVGDGLRYYCCAMAGGRKIPAAILLLCARAVTLKPTARPRVRKVGGAVAVGEGGSALQKSALLVDVRRGTVGNRRAGEVGVALHKSAALLVGVRRRRGLVERGVRVGKGVGAAC
jgi:hypothetical protein